jgi:MFS family permease
MVRFAQGLGDQFVTIACFTIITIQYPEDKETYVGLAEAVIGVGLMAGPVVGAFFYEWVQFQGTFYGFAFLMGACVIGAAVFLPNSLNRTNINVSTSIEDDKNDNPYGISYHMMVTNKRALVNMISGSFAMLFLVCFDSILSLRLKEFHVEDAHIGYVFAVPCLCYAFCSIYVGTLCKYMHRRNVTLLAFMFNTFALCVLGPSEMLHLPNNVFILLCGLALLGVAHAFIIVPLVPEIIHAIIDKEGLPDPPP